MSLPTEKQTRDTFPVTPGKARVMLVGTPGSGKTTLAASWAPDTTLIIDTQAGTTLLDGEHFVEHVSDWQGFLNTVQALATTEHHFETVVIDLIDDIWKFADRAYAGKDAPLASATDDWQKSINTAEGMYRKAIGTLLSLPIGVWFISHAREKQDGKITRYAPELDKKVLTYTQGATQYIFLAETLGAAGRLLHTQPSAKFEAKCRRPMPEPMELDAKAIWVAMDRGLNPEKWEKLDAAAAKKNGKAKAEKTTEPEPDPVDDIDPDEADGDLDLAVAEAVTA